MHKSEARSHAMVKGIPIYGNLAKSGAWFNEFQGIVNSEELWLPSKMLLLDQA